MLRVAAAGAGIATVFGAVWYAAGDKSLPQNRARLFATVSPSPAAPTSPSSVLSAANNAEAASLLAERLEGICPALRVDPSGVRFLEAPPAFFNFLLEAVARAERRIVISALYIGAGDHSQRLAAAIETAVQTRPGLEVLLLLDYGRMRAGANLKTLAPLLALASRRAENSAQVVVRLFQTPTSAGLFLEPFGRAREVVGVLHTKIFVFDDTVLMTGANLSDDYFVDRIDRYAVFENAHPLAEWYSQLAATISAVSHPLTTVETAGSSGRQHKRTGVAVWPNATGRNPNTDHSGFIAACTAEFDRFVQWVRELRDDIRDDSCTTFAFPTLQFGRIGIHHDEAVAEAVLSFAPDTMDDRAWQSTTTVASPYLNFLTEYIECIKAHAGPRHTYNVITSGQGSNGWKKTTGFTSLVPAFYQQLQRSFYWLMREAGLGEYVRLLEFCAEGQTMHAKGLWLSATSGSADSEQMLPYATAVGSSNYGFRSVHKDLESEIIVVTADPGLRRAMATELLRLQDCTVEVDDTRFVGDGDGRFQPVVSVVASLGQPYL